MTRFTKITPRDRLLAYAPRVYGGFPAVRVAARACVSEVARGAHVLEAHTVIAYAPRILEYIYPER